MYRKRRQNRGGMPDFLKSAMDTVTSATANVMNTVRRNTNAAGTEASVLANDITNPVAPGPGGGKSRRKRTKRKRTKRLSVRQRR